MTTNFGSDLYSVEDVDESRIVTGVPLVAQDALWRLQTPRAMGILAADAPTYGMDLLDAIGSVQTDSDLASLPGRIEAELRGDERIHKSTATITRSTVGNVAGFDIRIHCETAEGPFDLVGRVGDGTLHLETEMLKGGI